MPWVFSLNPDTSNLMSYRVASTGDVRRSVDSVDRKFGEKSLYLVPDWALLMYRSPGYLAGQVPR